MKTKTIHWTETTDHEVTLTWLSDSVPLRECRYYHEREIPESWQTDKPELYGQLREFIWEHRELEEHEFIDSDGELATIEESEDGWCVAYIAFGAVNAYSLDKLQSKARFSLNPRAWPRALAYAEKRTKPELKENEYQFPGYPVQDMRVEGHLLFLDDDGEDSLTRAELTQLIKVSHSRSRPTWRRMLDFYDREMMKCKEWTGARVWVSEGAARVHMCTSDPKTVREVSEFHAALCEVLEAKK